MGQGGQVFAAARQVAEIEHGCLNALRHIALHLFVADGAQYRTLAQTGIAQAAVGGGKGGVLYVKGKHASACAYAFG